MMTAGLRPLFCAVSVWALLSVPALASDTVTTASDDANINAFLQSKTAVKTPDKLLASAPTSESGPKPYTSLRQSRPLNSPLRGMSLSDTEAYRTAFTLIDKGDFTAGEAAVANVSDTSLMGYISFNKLFHANYSSTYEELMQWLDLYPDHPQAMRVWNLAKRKKPQGAEDPPFPILAANSGTARKLTITSQSLGPRTEIKAATAGPDSNLTPKSARSAYNNNQLEEAIRLGIQVGDRWVAGLAAWRLKRYAEAQKHFEFIVNDPSQNAWSQSGGAYWAGRSALKQKKAEEADFYFKIAASFPFTFYGLVAEQSLGVEPAVVRAQRGLHPVHSADTRGQYSASLKADLNWTRDDPQALRVNHLIQLNRRTDARTELQAAIQSSPDEEARNRWLAYASLHDLSISKIKPTDRLFDPSLYTMPEFEPSGGYKINKALIFSLAKKESKFNPKAKSYAGAYGLLQLAPATAAIVTKDNSLMRNPDRLLDANYNITIGQDYILRLLGTNIVDGDLFRAIAAYNAGEKWVLEAKRSLGEDADPLLFLESIPVAQTRQYTEEVIASYWIYRQLMGKESPTLEHAATGARRIDILKDL
ncbi:lytic transglycosylase domain-containing protein [Asticcacaulis tiandongensis]|uniref:lytic transglycosylase domain-containing protein n=1 Tax=Asticcacaulis tiandongensis TaxID=2565365 RepID=UPI00112D1276|nr:lytic transglycosylase domain-containing protein [Asticcacaulis tiandongensis]